MVEKTKSVISDYIIYSAGTDRLDIIKYLVSIDESTLIEIVKYFMKYIELSKLTQDACITNCLKNTFIY